MLTHVSVFPLIGSHRHSPLFTDFLLCLAPLNNITFEEMKTYVAIKNLLNLGKRKLE